MNVLVVAAHPDDEVLGVGGAIARHVRLGDRVTVAMLGEGITSRASVRAEADPTKVELLARSASEAGRRLGCEDIRQFDLPDNRFDSVDLLDVVKLIEGVSDDVKPELVYSHFWGDLNIDHQVTARATLTAFRPLKGSPTRRILAFEVPSATGWGAPTDAFAPTVFVDIAGSLQAKLHAMAAYPTEMRQPPHPRALESIEARARLWGAHVGLEAAEAFVLVREIER